MTLDDATNGVPVRIVHVGGEGSFRRRLLELGLLPGTRVTRLRVAPLGDPLEIWLRGCTLSLRRQEARQIEVEQDTASDDQKLAVAGSTSSAGGTVE